MRRAVSGFALLLAGGLAYACTGDDPTPASPTACTGASCEDGGGASETGSTNKLSVVKVEPQVLSLAPGASGTVKVTIDRSGGVASPVTLSAPDLGGGVSAAPVVIPAGEFQGTLSFTAAASATQSVPAPSRINAKADTGESADGSLTLSVRGLPGSVDIGFGTAGATVYAASAADDTVACVAVDAQGRIYVAGTIADGATTAMATARFTTDGALDATWGQNGRTSTRPPGSARTNAGGCMIDSAGRLVVVGSSTNGSAETDFLLARFKTGATDSGTLDTSFGASGVALVGETGRDDRAYAVTQVGALNDELMVSGVSGGIMYAVHGDSVASSFTKSSLTSGGLYDGAPAATAAGMVRGPLNTVLIGGAGLGFSSGSTASAIFWPISVQTFNSSIINSPHYYNGAFASAFTGGRIAVQADQRPVLAGGTDQFVAIRLVANGQGYGLDADFAGGKVTVPVGTGAAAAADLVIQGDGNIVLAGSAIGDASDFALVRLSNAGALDTSFGSGGKLVAAGPAGASDKARAAALLADGRIVVVGETTKAAGTSDWLLMRFWP